MTDRKKQALRTKQKIFKIAVSLMQLQGIENTTIEDICKKAHVSIGSFYNYFQSKNDIIIKVFEVADSYFREVAPELTSLITAKEKIMQFIRYYARYDTQQGLDFTKSLYNNSENKLFINPDRFMHTLLRDIIKSGQETNEISSKMTADEMVEFCFIISRGIVNDWCLHDGAYDLEQKMAGYFEQLMPLLLNQ